MKRVFLDTNIPIYAAGKESEYKKACLEVLEAIGREEVEGLTSTEVFQEILYRFWYLKDIENGWQIFDNFREVISQVLAVTEEDISKARELSEKYRNIKPRDLLHVAVMISNQIENIISVDKDFDAISEINRIDPLAFKP